MVDWTKLPEKVLEMISVHLFSAVELKRFRSICKTWRYSVSGAAKPLSTRPLIKLHPLVASIYNKGGQLYDLNLSTFLSRASFFRVALSSYSSQGWLIKSDVDINLGKIHLLHPLSRLQLHQWSESIDLLEFTVTEIGEGYLVHNSATKKEAYGFKKVIIVTVKGEDRVFSIGCDGKIRYWNGEIWTRVKYQKGDFSDIVVHRGLPYALDSKGTVWWISTSSFSLFKYGPSLHANITKGCPRDLSLVGCRRGELYIVERLLERNLRKRKVDSFSDMYPQFSSVIHDDVGNEKCELTEKHCPKTVGFKVYKIDEESRKWVQVKSLEDNAVVMAIDTSFSVVANEYYDCLPNAIYFTDKMEAEIKVFKLDDGSIKTMSAFELSCFQMFIPCFL